jgi:lipoate-protein ligase A
MDVVHQHGTILREVNPALMFTLLKVPNEKIRDKMIKAVGERVTSINGYLKRNTTFEELKEALVSGFEEAFKTELAAGEILEFEEQSSTRLEAEKYATKE